MSPKLVVALCAVLSFPAVAMADPDTAPKKTEQQAARMSASDVAVLQHRHDVNVMEIEMGRMAMQRGGAKVKKYASALVKDHQKSDKEAMALAKARGVTLTAHAMPANEVERANHEQMMKTMERLGTLEGAQFDREYLAAMVDGHTAEVGRITTDISTVTDAKLKAFLVKGKPVIERHAEQARALMTPAPAAEVKDSTRDPKDPKATKPEATPPAR